MSGKAKKRGLRDRAPRQVTVPLSEEELARVEALTQQMVTPGVWASRSDVLRMLVLSAMRGAEKAPGRFQVRQLRKLTG